MNRLLLLLKARVHKFIMKQPEGYDTMIDEDGGNISRGKAIDLYCPNYVNKTSNADS